MGKCVPIGSSPKFKRARTESTPEEEAKRMPTWREPRPLASWQVSEDSEEYWARKLKEARRRDAERYGGTLPYRPWYEY